MVREATPAGTIATMDVPLADAWQSVAPRELLIPNGAATAGFALPAAIAAALARDERRVVALGAAPGVVAMAGELATAARLATPIVVIAFDQDGSAAALPESARAAGFVVFVAEDEPAFGTSLTQAWAMARPALIVARVRG